MKRMKMRREVRVAVVKKVATQHCLPNFGNAGLVDNMLGQGQLRHR